MDKTEGRILLVDDEADILEFLSYNLRKEGFEVKCARNGLEAMEISVQFKPDLIILDVMMPGMDGYEACRQIRSHPDLKETVIAFLTARGEDMSQVEGFDSGADDYIRKPVRPRVFISRVKALLRRIPQTSEDGSRITFGDLIIDKEKYVVIKRGIETELSKKEFELLLLLTSRPNKVFTRDEIFAGVWGNDVIVGERTIDVHIRKIREKIGMESIKTIKGVGYYFT
ncbi:MAG: DNA-binding response regulator [Bacteroidetes bacterium HGW-Bacteroidetes-11]|jgi:two-component system alkaline phosphatase synthesis response regulator PhoP|nr:MAG: DNA-binding response regulator [Bacteroidetes bacterium HGW-Bacteroidetes-11]